MQTPKQERNGVPGPAVTHNSAMPGPDATSEIAARKGQAQSLDAARLADAAALIASPQGSGVDGHVVNAGGDMWDWDSGLAVAEMPGEK